MTAGLEDCRREHLPGILALLNHAIETSTALYDYKPRTLDQMGPWWEAKVKGGFPVLGAFEGGTLLGFATYGVFRAWPAYKYTAEHSLYVAEGRRGRGIGRTLLAALVERARAQGLHVLVGGIDSANAASIRLHESLGFRHAGTLAQVGFKFGRWLDLAFYQLILPTPDLPLDG